MNELVAKITVFAWDEKKGSLSEIEIISALAANDTSEPSEAAVLVHPSGRFLYATTRNDNAIGVFSIDRKRRALVAGQRVSSRGEMPLSCAIDPSGRYLVTTNQATETVVIFQINPGTGELAPVGPMLTVPVPVSSLFVPV